MGISGKPNATFAPDLLRSFVAVVEARSFTAAAAQLNATQSTVSQKIMRLEQAAGQRLVSRRREGVALTEAGERFLGYARRILALNAEAAAALSGEAGRVTLRLGLPEDFVSGPINARLAGFVRRNPQVKLEVTSGLSRGLARAYRRGELDFVMVKQHRGAEAGTRHWPEPLVWVESAAAPQAGADPISLVAFAEEGLYRAEMMSALDSVGLNWRLAYTSASLAGIVSAVEAGLGISLLPRRVVRAGLREIPGLPGIVPMEIVVHVADPGLPFAAEMLAILSDAVLAEGTA